MYVYDVYVGAPKKRVGATGSVCNICRICRRLFLPQVPFKLTLGMMGHIGIAVGRFGRICTGTTIAYCKYKSQRNTQC